MEGEMRNLKFVILAVAVAAMVAGCCPCRKLKIRQAAKEMVGIEWKMIQYGGKSFENREGYTITFGAENTFTGAGDCNRMKGKYVVNDDGTLKVELPLSTRMMCSDQEMENEFFKMIQAVESWQMDGKLLMLFNHGELVAVFNRQ